MKNFPVIFLLLPCYAEIDPLLFFSRKLATEILMESAFVDDIVVGFLTDFCDYPLYFAPVFAWELRGTGDEFGSHCNASPVSVGHVGCKNTGDIPEA